MNYRELLIKYINMVGEEEGVSFIDHDFKPIDFTEEEWEEMKKLDDESREYWKIKKEKYNV